MPSSLPSKIERVCFVSARSGFITNETCQMDFADGRLFNEIKEQFNGNLGLAIFSDSELKKNYTLSVTCSEIVKLPFPFSYFGGLINTMSIYKILNAVERKYDAFIIQLPIVSFLPLLFLNKPIIFHVCANVLTAANNPIKYKGYHRLSAIAFAYLMHIIHKILFKSKKNRVIVNGNELGMIYRSYDPKVIVSSSIYTDEVLQVSSVVNTPRSIKSFNLVFVGRPSLEKGFDMLINVFLELNRKNYNVNLSLVGINRQDIENLYNIDHIEIHSLMKKIIFYGFIPWGDEFKSILLRGDCLLMCSISEGTPRVLIEARAYGCPVIATDVGGVSTSVTNLKDGFLVRIGDVDDMVNKIIYLINSPLVRKEIILEGLKTAKKYSIENMARVFVSTIDGLK